MNIAASKPIDWTGAKRVSLALQGGGAHGAFTWGVLDQILADGRLDIEAISGCSAGAMNAVVLAEGYLEGGRAGAREKLEQFWHSVSDDGTLPGVTRQIFQFMNCGVSFEQSPAFFFTDLLTHYASPYEFNPLDINPLRDHLHKMIDFKKVSACTEIELFIAATNVRTGKVAIFKRAELTVDHLMASACLPYLYKAVEIDGVPYWDGGYMGNPALYPLCYQAASQDILLIQVNPIERTELPTTAREIQNRVNEITFNGALLREFRAIEFVNRLIDEGKLSDAEYRRAFMHRIDGGHRLANYSAASKLNTSWEFLKSLRDLGRETAVHFLDMHYEQIGTRGTLNLREAFSGDDLLRTVDA
ncbi:MAG: patatin-like phospholipase family protein [Hyphomicrobiales bacterium]|nr:patatin-like phospholipase family protein [Hyphomicrobiales bacterium]MDE2114112.1 patatin-like phospholipase family protein [Hyphomicrobiales bacterium]